MNRKHLLAAELYSYSYANYQGHLGIGNVRFEALMPRAADVLDTAVQQDWPISKIASRLETDEEDAKRLLAAFRRAVEIVDAPNAAETFRRGVRYSIRDAVTAGLASEEDIEKLVIQICYRAADMAFVLEREGVPLSRYSSSLRREDGVTYSPEIEPN